MTLFHIPSSLNSRYMETEMYTEHVLCELHPVTDLTNAYMYSKYVLLKVFFN